MILLSAGEVKHNCRVDWTIVKVASGCIHIDCGPISRDSIPCGSWGNHTVSVQSIIMHFIGMWPDKVSGCYLIGKVLSAGRLGYQTSPTSQTFMDVSEDMVLWLDPLLDLMQELHAPSATTLLAQVSITCRQGVGGVRHQLPARQLEIDQWEDRVLIAHQCHGLE